MKAACFAAAIAVIHKIGGIAVIYNKEDLRLDAKRWTCASFWDAGTETFTGRRITRCMHPVDFYCVSRFDLTIVISGIGREFCLG